MSESTALPGTINRQYYIDWVRVLAFFLLIFFHCAMPFVKFGWEIKNSTTSLGLSRLIWWLHQWRLPLLFFISGAGISFSLRRRTVLGFAAERFVRLFIPLAFAMLFVIPLQVFFEKTQDGSYHGSYAAFYPSVWTFIPYPEGTLNWSHMWFVVYLFVYCILLLPVFGIFKLRAVAGIKQKISDLFSTALGLPLLSLPLMACFFTLFIKYPEQQSLFDDWFLFTFSLLLLFYGYFFGGNPKFWATCERFRWLYLSIAVTCIVTLFSLYWWSFNVPKKQDSNSYFYGFLNAMHIWFLLTAVLGFARKHLNFSNRFLRYANEAVYPYYIIHQTVIVAAGFYVVQWPLPIAIKLVILIIVCFCSVLLIFHFLIRPFRLTRILYGLRPKRKLNSSASAGV